MLTTHLSTVLNQAQREALAADFTYGGGSVLQAAIGVNPHPEVAFIHPGRPLVATDGQPLCALSLLDLDQLAQSWSVWYCGQGVKPRDRVAIYLEDSFAYSVHFFALSQIGAIPVMINSRASSALAGALCRQTTPVGIYTDGERLVELWREDSDALQGLRWTQVVEDVPAPAPAVLPAACRFRHAPEDPVSILHSSGTTGHPKPVIQTHQSSVAGPRFRMTSYTERPGARMMMALPQSHLGCIAYTTYAILCGTPLIPLYDPSGAELLAAVSEYRPTAVMAFSHAYGELAALDLQPGALDSVEAWVAMGDAIHEAHIKTILSRRSRELPAPGFSDRLGTTELGWGVLRHISTIGSEGKERCVGKATGVAELAILRPDGGQAQAGEYGLLGAKGPAITAGYWNDSDTTYRTRLGGYWLTGDVAYRDAEGFFFQVDRAVDAIATAAATGYSVFMEEVILSSVPEICDCAVVAGKWGAAAVAVAVVRCTRDGVDVMELLDAANRALRSADHPELALMELARSEADYPVGVTGKVLKRQLRERYGDLCAYLGQAGDRRLAAATNGEAGDPQPFSVTAG